MIRCVLYDFDGTITTCDTTRLLVRVLAQRRPHRLAFASPSIVQMHLRRGSAQQAAKNRTIGTLLAGQTVSEAKEAARRFATFVRPLFRLDLLKSIAAWRGQGTLVLVVTATAEFAVREAMAKEQVEVIGTRFCVEGDRFTGKLDGDGCYGERKRALIAEWVSRAAEPVRFIESWSDSLSDLPMMHLADVRHWIGPPAFAKKALRLDPNGNFHAI